MRHDDNSHLSTTTRRTTVGTRAALGGHVHRTALGLTVLSISLAGCGSPAEADPREQTTAGHEWAWVSDATTDHRDEAQEHHRLAEAHRAGSQALRDAEERACVGIREADRDVSPFEHREDIASVEPLDDPGRGGVRITFADVTGLTAEWLQRVVDCHIARNAALGHEVPEMPTCPLVPAGVTATVQRVDGHLAVDLRADTSAATQEVLRRAGSLVSP